jgi:hydrogenase maturation factor HypE
VRKEEVYRRIGEERTLRSTIHRRKRRRWVGHVIRHNNHVGSIMEQKIEGKALRGRPRDKNYGQVKKDTGKKSHREVEELAWNRKEWRSAVYQSYDYNTIAVVAPLG